MLKLKLQYFGHLMRRVDSLEKTDAGRDWGQEDKGKTEDEMAGWHHWLDGCESEWTLGVGDGHGGLARCDSWGCKQSDTTEWLNYWTVKKASICPLKVMLTLSVMSQINKCFLICFKRKKISIFQYFCKKIKSERNHEETAYKLPLRIRLWNQQSVLLNVLRSWKTKQE